MDKSAVVASAVLVSAFHLLHHNQEIVKRWTNEIQEAVQSKHGMVQFHAVALLHALRANDRLAVSKLVTSLTRSQVRCGLTSIIFRGLSDTRSVGQRLVATLQHSSGHRAGNEFASQESLPASMDLFALSTLCC